MHDRALGIARALVEILDLGGRRALLDVGGGPGTYSVLLTGQVPRAALRGARAARRRRGRARDRRRGRRVATASRCATATTTARTSAADGRRADVRHVPPRDGARLPRTHRSARGSASIPGGLLVVSDVFTDEGGTQPAFAAMFGLNMMLTAPDGGVHADADVTRWMADCGFVELRTTPLPPPMPHRVVHGRQAMNLRNAVFTLAAAGSLALVAASAVAQSPIRPRRPRPRRHCAAHRDPAAAAGRRDEAARPGPLSDRAHRRRQEGRALHRARARARDWASRSSTSPRARAA